jgi:undecaprenyl phosphate-alpha-L-ara4N flippase subunit ArnE
MMALRIGCGLGIMIAFTVVANLLMKIGASVPFSERPIFAVIAWQSLLGVAAFGCAAVIYAWLLQWMPLNVMQSLAALQFIAVILASSVALSEQIPTVRWLGITLIAAGIVVVTLTTRLPSAASQLSAKQSAATANPLSSSK